MKIKNIKINNYGNLENKEINLKNNINIIYGKNESGKSTVLNYIKNIFYGISKNKNGKNISDYEKYKPWGKEDYSGKIKYELDTGEEFEIFREFNKKNPKVYNNKLEDISKQFNVVKKDGIQFFYDQTGVDETMFTSTVVSMQEEVKLDTQEQNILVQKLANHTGTGEETLSYKKVIDKLNKLQVEEIGNDRTQGRPINIIKDRMKNIEFVLKELQTYQKDKQNNEMKKDNYNKTIIELQDKLDIFKQVNIIKISKQNTDEKIIIKNNYKNEKNKKIEELKLEKNNLIKEINENKIKLEKNNNKKIINKTENKKIKKYFLFFIILLIINILFFILNKKIIKNNLFNLLNYFLIPIYLIIILILEKNNNKKIKKEINNEKENTNSENEKIKTQIDFIEKQISTLQNEIDEEEKEIEKEQMNLDNQVEVELLKIKEKYKNKLNINNYLEKIENNSNIDNIINQIQDNLNKNKIELQTLNIKEDDITKKLEEMVNLKEEYDKLKEQLEDLEKRNNTINLAKEFLTRAYTNMKNNVTPKFTDNLSYNISEITQGKYNKVSINDEKGLIVENEYGEYVPVEMLSIGTIDQLYLSLRLSMIDDLSNEKMPIILDEAFAYYDDERLKNILIFLSNNAKEHQVIIFTCTKREQEILNKLNIEYNLVEM